MKKYVLPLLAVLISTTVMAAGTSETPKDLGPENISFKMGIVVLPFQHRLHQKRLNNECYHCHDKSGPGKIKGWGKESAHTICIACHDLDDKGPVECLHCHKK
jgi:hypothetical protein